MATKAPFTMRNLSIMDPEGIAITSCAYAIAFQFEKNLGAKGRIFENVTNVDAGHEV